MADEADNSDDTLDLTTDQIITDQGADDDSAGDDTANDGGADNAGQAGDDEGEEETVISFGDDDPDAEQPDDNNTLREIRKRNRELNARIRELEQSKAPPKVELGEKPTLAACDYDEEKYETELDAWKQRKAESERAEKEAQETDREVQEQWQADFRTFQEKKAALNLPDIEECQETVESGLNLVQQAVMVKSANDPALVMVALAKSPAKLAELQKIKDPIKLAAAIARLEGGIKVVKKRKGPNIDKPQQGSGAVVGSTDQELEKLEREAAKTGDRSKVIKYKRQLRRAAK